MPAAVAKGYSTPSRAPGRAEGWWGMAVELMTCQSHQSCGLFPDLGAPRSGSISVRASTGAGRPPRPSLPPSLPLPPSPPVVFLFSPGCAQPEPHRTWAGGSRPGLSRQLSGAPRARSPSARSLLPGGPGRAESTPDPSPGLSSPPTHQLGRVANRHPPIPSWRSLSPTPGSALLLKTIIIFATVWKEPSLITSPPGALLPILQPFSCDPRRPSTHRSAALSPALRASPPTVPLPHPWVLAGRATAHNPRHGQGQKRDHKLLWSPPDLRHPPPSSQGHQQIQMLPSCELVPRCS